MVGYIIKFLVSKKGKDKTTTTNNVDKHIGNIRRKHLAELSQNMSCKPEELYSKYMQVLKTIPFDEFRFREEMQRLEINSEMDALILGCKPQDTKPGIMLDIYQEYYNQF